MSAVVKTIFIIIGSILLIRSNETRFVDHVSIFFSPSPDVVTNCRMSCLNEYISELNYIYDIVKKCSNDRDCSTCCQYCAVLYSANYTTAFNVCKDRQICTTGCRNACRHFRISMHHEKPKNDYNQLVNV